MGGKIVIKVNIMVVFILLLILGAYWRFFLPGPRVATDFPLVSDNQLKSLVDLPRVWSEGGAEGLGEYSIFFLWSWPLNFITGILSNLGISFSFLERIIFLIPMLVIGTYGILKLTKNLNFSSPIGLICALFFLTNTYILLLIDGGQLSIGLTYAFFPVSLLAVEKSINGRLREKILAAVAVSVLGFLDIRFVYILLILYVIRFFYQFLFLDKEKTKGWIFDWLKTGLVAIPIILGLHFYWLLPLLQDPASKTTYSFLTQFSSSNLNLGHSLLLISPHWYKNIFGVISPLRWEFVLIPVLVFSAPILKPKNQSVGFWLLVVLISVFLAKGDTQPFTNFYHWLFNNIPYFSVFQDSTKLFVLVVLSYTILLGFTLDEISKRIKSIRLKNLIFLFFHFYLIFLSHPVWLGWTTGTFSQSPQQKEYQKLGGILQQETSFSRIFWIPSFPPLGYIDPNHPRVEAARLVQRRPFAAGAVGSYEFINFLREAPYMGEIFDVAGIGYIVYPYLDERRDNLHPDNIKYYYTFGEQLSKLPWLSKVENSPVPVWETRKHMDKFFITPNIWWVVGSDNIYNEVIKSSQLALSKNALIFVEESPGLSSTIDQLPEAKIVLNNKTTTDLAASFIKPTQLIFPAKQLNFDPDQSGWWKREAKDLIWWRYFLQTKYGVDNLDFDLGGGWAVGEGESELRIKNKQSLPSSEGKELREDRVLLARVLESTRGGQLKFYQEDKLIGQINTKKERNNVRWFEVGELTEDHENLTIESSGDINVVNALAILDKNEWIQFQNKARSLSDRVVSFSEENTRLINADVTYQQINPTKYLVKIRNLTGPNFLVFSQSYDKNWRMDGQESLPIYSLLNGFRIDQDGEYEIYFEPQKYVYPGLIISLSTLALIMYLILIHKHKQSGI